MRTTRKDSGASLLEAAIVAPVILLIVFSIIELSFAYRSASITSTAARSGARLAASTYGDAAPADQATVRDAIATAVNIAIADLRPEATPTRMLIFESTSTGTPLSGNLATCGASCMSFTWDTATNRFVHQSGSWTDPDNCGIVLDRVGVYVEVAHRPTAPLLSTTIKVDEVTVMRLEPGAFSTCTSE